MISAYKVQIENARKQSRARGRNITAVILSKSFRAG